MSKRRSNVNLKAKRSRSWQRGQDRKDRRIAAQLDAQGINRKFGVTAWQTARQIRSARRAQDPEVQERRRRHEAGLR